MDSYHIIKAVWQWLSLKGHGKVSIELVQDTDLKNIPVEFRKTPKQSLKSDHINKISWPWPSMKG